MSWDGKHDSEMLAEQLRRRLSAKSRKLTEKRMFGGVCFLLNGNMLCAAGKNGYMIRTDPARAAEAAELPGGRPVVMQGRTMQGFYWIDPEACEAKAIGRWLTLAQDYVAKLPPKAARAKKRR